MPATSAELLWDQAAIAAETGLSLRKVRDYLDKLKELLHPLGNKDKSPNQQWQFGAEGLRAFQRIKELRDSGLQLPQIRAQLAKELTATGTPGSLPRQTPADPTAALAEDAPATLANPGKSEDTALVAHLKDELQQSRKREDDLDAKLATANEKRLEQEQNFRKEQKDLLLQLSEKEGLIGRQGTALRQLTGGLDLEVYQQHIATTASQRQEIINELKRLNGKWWKRRRRKELLTKLAQLGQGS